VHAKTRELLGEPDAELVFGLTAAVGTDLEGFVRILEKLLKVYGYTASTVRLSALLDKIDPAWLGVPLAATPEFDRIWTHMDAGDALRNKMACGEALALWAVASVNAQRKDAGGGLGKEPLPKHAHIFRTVKHPDEVRVLREVYKAGFYLIALHASEEERLQHLTTLDGMSPDQAERLVRRDQGDNEPSHGQQTRDTFQMADVFILQGPKMSENLDRFLGLIFSNPLITPTRDEHAMFMAYSASLRSADLSRQVGAVLRKDGVGIVGTGCNDVPAPGGGLYWPDDPTFDSRDYRFPRKPGGTGGHDSNERHKREIADDVVKRVKDDFAGGLARILADFEKRSTDAGSPVPAPLLEQLKEIGDAELAGLSQALQSSVLKTRIFDITEFGRAVHAEMEALLSCTRSGASTRGATLLCTTFPCHNCAKHIVDSGIRRVVYIEPYPKSQTMDLHRDSVKLDESCTVVPATPSENLGSERNHVEPARPVVFQPFIGIGPRRFMDFFSMRLSSGLPAQRKIKETGDAVTATKAGACVRVPMSTRSYLEREDTVVALNRLFMEKAK
jgi:deoxycytidylate deaminase